MFTQKTPDKYNLQRFLGAQESFYAQALKEIRDGSKTSHWIWFIFPQVRGLGHSPRFSLFSPLFHLVFFESLFLFCFFLCQLARHLMPVTSSLLLF